MDGDEELLKDPQKDHIASALSRVLAAGWGEIELVVDKGQLRWIRPARRLSNAAGAPLYPVASGGLDQMLGEWREVFYRELGVVLGLKYGRIRIGIEHGRVSWLEPSPSLPA